MDTRKVPQCSLKTEQGIDLSAALQRLRGDHRLLLTLIDYYLDDYPPVVAEVHRAAERENAEELAMAAHSLKGLAANFDAQEVIETIAAIEKKAKAGELGSAKQLLPRLDTALSRLTADLRGYRDAHAS